MTQSRYLIYALSIARRDHMIGLIFIYVLCAFVVTWAITSTFPKMRAVVHWIFLGGFYAALLGLGIIPALLAR